MTQAERRRRRSRRPLRDAAQLPLYPVTVLFMHLVAWLPARHALWLGRRLGELGYHVLRFRRSVVLGNLRHVFGDELEEGQLRRLAVEVYRQTLMTLIELFRSGVADPERFEYDAEFVNISLLRDLADRGRPAIVCMPHLGNFYLTGFAATREGIEFYSVVKKLQVERFERLLQRARSRMGMRSLDRKETSLHQLARMLKRGEWIVLLPDQNARDRGIVVDFLGRPASTFQGPAFLHYLTGAPILLIHDERDARDPTHHRIHAERLPDIELTGDRSRDVEAITRRMCDAMSEAIRRRPAQYLWFHRRWGSEASRTPPSTARRQEDGE